MQHADAGIVHGGDDAARVARHVGHLGGDGLAAKTLVQAVRNLQHGLEKRLVHRLRFYRIGYAVPHNITPSEHLLQSGHILWALGL